MEVNSYKLLQEGTNPKRKGISLPHSRMLFRSTSIQIVRKKENPLLRYSILLYERHCTYETIYNTPIQIHNDYIYTSTTSAHS